MGRRERVEYGDWQTPIALARAALDTVMRTATRSRGRPASILEPTCGEGAFLEAAASLFPRALLVGHEISAPYARRARTTLTRAGVSPDRARIHVGDFFQIDWERVIGELPQPVLVTGNPPWVTNAGVGALRGTNLPPKENAAGLKGLDARTGKSNFDVSEWMILRLLEALGDRRATLAMLCKSVVARRIIEHVARRGMAVAPGGLWKIDAAGHFDAAVDAVLFVCETGRRNVDASANATWPVFTSLDAHDASAAIGVRGGVLVADAERYTRTLHLAGTCEPEWRSGIKHDCARVMELDRSAAGWVNRMGERVDVEDAFLFPLLKSSDVANGRARDRVMIVPQRALGEDTRALRKTAPKLWRYLTRHRGLLDARKSSIYRGQAPFAIFGVGPYTFAPWKVAISGLYKRCVFTLVGPNEAARPVVFDDTCYFLPFTSEAAARRARTALESPLAHDFLTSRVFWDAKRPINKALLQSLDLSIVLHC